LLKQANRSHLSVSSKRSSAARKRSLGLLQQDSTSAQQTTRIGNLRGPASSTTRCTLPCLRSSSRGSQRSAPPLNLPISSEPPPQQTTGVGQLKAVAVAWQAQQLRGVQMRVIQQMAT
jgi:hypothetical protein